MIRHDDEFAQHVEPERYALFKTISARRCYELSEAQCIYWDDDAVWEALMAADIEYVTDLNRINGGDATSMFIGSAEHNLRHPS